MKSSDLNFYEPTRTSEPAHFKSLQTNADVSHPPQFTTTTDNWSRLKSLPENIFIVLKRFENSINLELEIITFLAKYILLMNNDGFDG